jgi:cupin fold WbuC family metalloprotein
MEDASKEARASERKRSNYNFHTSYNDPIQRFLNAVEPDTYLRPHKHDNQDKTEIFLILKGRILILEFDDNGEILDHIILDSEGGNKGVEIPYNIWHSFISLQESSVLYEIKEGPFIQETGKIFANWSPEEGTKEAHGFNNKILQKLKISPENLQ